MCQWYCTPLRGSKVTAALEEYVAILHEDPENDKIRQAAADLYIQVNDTQQATKLLGELFYRQVDAGDGSSAARRQASRRMCARRKKWISPG